MVRPDRDRKLQDPEGEVMTLEEIKAAVDAGKTVHWATYEYVGATPTTGTNGERSVTAAR